MTPSARFAAHHRRRVTAFTLVAGALSLVLFGYSLRTVGLREIGAALGRLGPAGFALVIALSGTRLLVRSLAWMTCVEGERRLGFRDALSATVMGEALGNSTPFAVFVSEPAKALFVRDRVPLALALSAIVVENIVYSATVAVMIGLGAIAFLLAFPMPSALRAACLVAIGGTLAIVGGAWLLLGAGAKPVSGAMGWLSARGFAGRWLGPHLERVRGFEERINTFTARNRQRLGALALYESAFHLAGVAEVSLTLWFIAPDAATLLKALVLEAVGRVINVLFKFIPMRFGVDEAGNLLLARPLGLPQAALLAVPLVRKARILVWTALGILMLFRRGLSVRSALEEAREAGREPSGG